MFYLKLETIASDYSIREAISELIAIANRLQLHVEAELNGVKVNAYPGDDPDRLFRAWELASKTDDSNKYAFVHDVP